MSEVEIRLYPIVGHKNFTMLERIQRTRIDVEVGIEFLDGYGKAASLEHGTKRRRSKPFAERGKNSTRDENESGFSGHIYPP